MLEAVKSWVDHPEPRIVSEACGVEQRIAQRKPNRSRSAVGTMSELGFWVGATTMVPAAGLAADDDVAFRQRDRHLIAVLSEPDRDRVPQAQADGSEVRPGERLVPRQRVPADDVHVGVAGVGPVTGDPYLPDPEERCDG